MVVALRKGRMNHPLPWVMSVLQRESRIISLLRPMSANIIRGRGLYHRRNVLITPDFRVILPARSWGYLLLLISGFFIRWGSPLLRRLLGILDLFVRW
jgi:hypothetical protein